jgi:hypothetical protein
MKPTPVLLLVPIAWASLAQAQQSPQSPPAHVWRASQATDAARTLTFTRFTLAGKFLSSPHNQDANRPALTMDCIPATGSHPSKGKFLAGNLVVGTTMKIIYVEPEEIHGTSYEQKVAVRYRTDDGSDEERENWSPGLDKISTSIPKDSLKKILRARTVSISLDDERGSELAMQFDMPDPAQVEAACNVDEHR